MSTLIDIPLSAVQPSPYNRERSKRYSPASLETLAANIKELDQVIEPAIVRPLGESGQYELVAGERRWRASALAERETLPCIVRDLTDRQVCDIMLSENLQRENLTPIEEACVFADMLQATDGGGQRIYPTMDTLFEVTGKKRDVIENRLKLLNCPEFLLAAIEKGEVAPRVGELVGRVADETARGEAAKRAMKSQFREGAMTVKEVAAMLKEDFMTSLNNCGFDPEDADLVPLRCLEGVRVEGGSCENCIYRSGNDTGLQGALTEAGGEGRTSGFDGRMCTKPTCFRLKQAAAARAIEKHAEAQGLRVMPKEKGKRLLKARNADLDVYVVDGDKYIAQDEQPGHEHTGHFANDDLPTWGELLEGEKVSWLIVKDGKKARYFLESDIAAETADAKRRRAGEPLLFKKGRKGSAESASTDNVSLPETKGLKEVEAGELELEGMDSASPTDSSSDEASPPTLTGQALEKRNFKVNKLALEMLADAWRSGGVPKESALEMLRLTMETGPCDIGLVSAVAGIDYEPGRGISTVIDYARNALDGRGIALLAYVALVASDIEANGIDDAVVTQRLMESHGVDLAKVRKMVDDAEAEAAKTPKQKALDELHKLAEGAGFIGEARQIWLDSLAERPEHGFVLKSTDPRAGTQEIYALTRVAKRVIKETGLGTPELPGIKDLPRTEVKSVGEASELPAEGAASGLDAEESPPLPFVEALVPSAAAPDAPGEAKGKADASKPKASKKAVAKPVVKKATAKKAPAKKVAAKPAKSVKGKVRGGRA